MIAAGARIIRGALGLPCWQVRWDGQVGLDMNFGEPHMVVRQPRKSDSSSARVRALFARRAVFLRGTHALVAYPGCWRLRTSDGAVVRESHSVKRLNSAVGRLSGEIPVGLAIDPFTGRSEFFFDLGGRVSVRWPPGVAIDDDAELWSMHSRSRYVAVFAGGRYATGSRRVAAEERKPFHATTWLVLARSKRRERAILRQLEAEGIRAVSPLDAPLRHKA